MTREGARRSAAPFVALAALVAAGCSFEARDGDRIRGSGDIVTDVRPLDDFTRIELAGEGAVVFDEGGDGQIEIDIDDNLLDLIETEVSNETLTITTEPGHDLDPSERITYRLGCPDVTRVVIAGAGSIDLAGCATASELELELGGAGTIVATELRIEQVAATLAGAGTIVLGGDADDLGVTASGAGAIEGSNLRSGRVVVDASGVADVTVWAVENLTADVSGTGTVRYWGDPVVDETTSGIGSVTPLGPR